MNFNSSTPLIRFLSNYLRPILIAAGNSLTVLGCLGVGLGMLGLFDMEFFAFGLSSGIRIVGSVAIAGCLFSAIGYGIADYTNK